MQHAPPLLTQSRVEAFTASALGFVCWLFGAVVQLGLSGRSRKLRDLITSAEHAVETTIFLHAVARFGVLPPKRHRHPASAPAGFRIARSRLKLFYKRANIRARKAGAVERIFRLIEALQNPDRAIAYFLKRIRKGLHPHSFIVVASATAATHPAFAPLPQIALDSS